MARVLICGRGKASSLANAVHRITLTSAGCVATPHSSWSLNFIPPIHPPQIQVVNANGAVVNQPQPTSNKINLAQPVRNFKQQVTNWPDRQEGMDLQVRLMKQKELPDWVFSYNGGVNPCLSLEEVQVGGCLEAGEGHFDSWPH